MAFEYPQWGAPANVHAAMTLRGGGFSQGPFASLNLATRVGDAAENVAHNREKLRSVLNLPAEPCWLEQVHSKRLALNGQADGSYTREAGRVLAVQCADCLPLLVCSASGDEIAAVHCGWRGLQQGIIAETLALFSSHELMAWIGPHIRQCHYEVGCELRQAFSDYPGAFRPGRDKEHWQLDLSEVARWQLMEGGMGTVTQSADCTYCDKAKYFSHRRDGQCGRMAALIWKD